jgi:hypothetical protein
MNIIQELQLKLTGKYFHMKLIQPKLWLRIDLIKASVTSVAEHQFKVDAMVDTNTYIVTNPTYTIPQPNRIVYNPDDGLIYFSGQLFNIVKHSSTCLTYKVWWGATFGH